MPVTPTLPLTISSPDGMGGGHDSTWHYFYNARDGKWYYHGLIVDPATGKSYPATPAPPPAVPPVVPPVVPPAVPPAVPPVVPPAVPPVVPPVPDMGTLPWTQGTPQEYYEAYPEASWINRLQTQGLYGYNPYQRWLRDQQQRTYTNWLLNSMNTYGGGGTPKTYWESAPTFSQPMSAWNQLMGQPGNSQARGYYEDNPAQAYNAYTQVSGAPAPLKDWLDTQMSSQYRNWQAGGPTQTQTWLEYLNSKLGNRTV